MTKNRSRTMPKGCLLAILLTGVSLIGYGQAVSLSDLEVKENILVDFKAHANGETVVTPTCGASSSERQLLCAGTARLEVRQGKSWVRARSRFDGAILGSIGPDHQGFAVLKASPTSNLEFVFSKLGFAFPRGAYVRIAVDTWMNEDAFRNGKASATVWSEPFRCP